MAPALAKKVPRCLPSQIGSETLALARDDACPNAHVMGRLWEVERFAPPATPAFGLRARVVVTRSRSASCGGA